MVGQSSTPSHIQHIVVPERLGLVHILGTLLDELFETVAQLDAINLLSLRDRHWDTTFHVAGHESRRCKKPSQISRTFSCWLEGAVLCHGPWNMRQSNDWIRQWR